MVRPGGVMTVVHPFFIYVPYLFLRDFWCQYIVLVHLVCDFSITTPSLAQGLDGDGILYLF